MISLGKSQSFIKADKILLPNVRFDCMPFIDSLGYHCFENIEISKYYYIHRKIDLDLNLDEKKDIIIILNPEFQQKFGIPTVNSCFEKRKRLFVLCLGRKDGFIIDVVNENLILNIYDYNEDPFSDLSISADGFKLKFEFGSIINYDIDFFFSRMNGKVYLTHKRQLCFSADGGSRIIEKKFPFQKFFLVSSVNLIDLIDECE